MRIKSNAMEINHGFVVQNSVIPLDLSPSKDHIPVVFIASLNDYTKYCSNELCYHQNDSFKNTSVVFWDYFDSDRQIFEDNIFKDYEQSTLFELHSKARIRNYLRICKVMCRCSDFEESTRIFSLLVDLLMKEFVDDSQLIADFLETVCVTYETILTVFLKNDDVKYLDSFLFHLSNEKRDLFGFWSQSISDCNLISQFLFKRQYDRVMIALRYGLLWEFCQSVFIDYCKAFDSSWTIDMLTQSVGLYDTRNIDRFFRIIQTYFLVMDWKTNGHQDSLDALFLVWRSIPDVYIAPQEMATSMRSLSSHLPAIKEREIAEISEAYDNLFWNNQNPKCSPRNLKDLCRCTIRHRLSENFQLPYGLSELNLPYRVQMFLELKI